jgi:nuclear cap-binding protein subunit 1
MKLVEEDVSSIAKTVCDNYEDEELRESFCDLTVQLIVEQPLKISFVAAVVLVVNTMRKEVVEGIITRASTRINKAIVDGEWRDVKLYLKFLGSLQGLLDGDGVFPVLEELLTKAIDLQTESSEEVSILGYRLHDHG